MRTMLNKPKGTKFTFKPGDEVLVDGYIKAKVKQLGPIRDKVTVTVESKLKAGKVMIWHVFTERCIPNTEAAKTLYLYKN